MVEHESHFVSMAVDPGDAVAKRGHQVIDRPEQHVGQDGSFQMAPQPFDQVETRAVRRQPEDGDLIGMLGQERPHRLRVMETSVVADEANLPAGIGSQQDDQERDEVPAALGVGHRVGDPAGGIVDTPVNDLLLVLARGRNLGLLADRRPHAGQRRMTVNLHLVLKDQNFRGAACVAPFLAGPVVGEPSGTPLRRVCPSWCVSGVGRRSLPDAKSGESDRRGSQYR